MNEYIKDGLRVFVVPVDILDREDLTIHEKMTYIVLRSFANPTEMQSFPSYATIAKKASMSRRQAMRCVDSLVEKGCIRKEMRYTVTKNKLIKNSSNIYTIGPVGDSQSLGVVTHSHQGGDSQSLGVVTHSHQGGDSQSPDQIQLIDPRRIDLDQIDPDIIKAIEKTGLSRYTREIVDVYESKKTNVTKEVFISVLYRVAEKKDKVKSLKGYLIRSLKNESLKNRVSGLPESVVNPKVQEISEEELQSKLKKTESLLKLLYHNDEK